MVYRYTLKDKALPGDRNIVYSLITDQKKDLTLEIESFASTREMLEHDQNKNQDVK